MIPVVYTKAMRSFIRYRQLHLSPSQFLEEDVFSSEIEVKTEKKGRVHLCRVDRVSTADAHYE